MLRSKHFMTRLPSLLAEPPTLTEVSKIVRRAPRVAVFGTEADKREWTQWLLSEAPTYKWFGSVAEALLELRAGTFDAAFVPSSRVATSALQKLAQSVPIVLVKAELAKVKGPAPVLLTEVEGLAAAFLECQAIGDRRTTAPATPRAVLGARRSRRTLPRLR